MHPIRSLLLSWWIYNFSEGVKLISKVDLACEGGKAVRKLHLNVSVVLGLGTALMNFRVLPIA